MKKFMKWPTGKYNGKRIDGFKVSAKIHLLWWNWLPKASFNFGEPYFIWLCFTFRAEASYE